MDQRRLKLNEILKDICPNVYFQPPASLAMSYPCIVYSRDSMNNDHANNSPYRVAKRYQVTVISRDPDDEIADKVALLSSSSFARHFKADALNHDVYNLYF